MLAATVGETVLSLEEVKKLCDHYKVSLDALLSPSSEIIFCQRYSTLLLFKFPELALFKMFFWMKSYQRHPTYEKARYQPELVSQQLLTTGKKLWDKYAEVPSSEIWSDETFNVTIRQVEFYLENGFITLRQAQALLDVYLVMTNDIRQRAAMGMKNEKNGLFRRNEFLISDTTFLFKMGDRRMAFITYNTMNILNTEQESFCRETEDYLTNIINKSTLISTTGERERNKFFNLIEKRILQSKELLR